MSNALVETRPLTPQEMLDRYAEMHHRYPVGTKTVAGGLLKEDLASFLTNAAVEGIDEGTAMVDLAAALARTVVAISMSFHNGRPCADCIGSAVDLIISEIAVHTNTLIENTSHIGGGLH